MIIYGWQQLEGIKENVPRLFASDTRRDRRRISQRYEIMQMVNALQELRRDKFTIAQQEKLNNPSIASLNGSEIYKKKTVLLAENSTRSTKG